MSLSHTCCATSGGMRTTFQLARMASWSWLIHSAFCTHAWPNCDQAWDSTDCWHKACWAPLGLLLGDANDVPVPPSLPGLLRTWSLMMSRTQSAGFSCG